MRTLSRFILATLVSLSLMLSCMSLNVHAELREGTVDLGYQWWYTLLHWKTLDLSNSHIKLQLTKDDINNAVKEAEAEFNGNFKDLISDVLEAEQGLRNQGLTPSSPDWDAAWNEVFTQNYSAVGLGYERAFGYRLPTPPSQPQPVATTNDAQPAEAETIEPASSEEGTPVEVSEPTSENDVEAESPSTVSEQPVLAAASTSSQTSYHFIDQDTSQLGNFQLFIRKRLLGVNPFSNAPDYIGSDQLKVGSSLWHKKYDEFLNDTSSHPQYLQWKRYYVINRASDFISQKLNEIISQQFNARFQFNLETLSKEEEANYGVGSTIGQTTIQAGQLVNVQALDPTKPVGASYDELRSFLNKDGSINTDKAYPLIKAVQGKSIQDLRTQIEQAQTKLEHAKQLVIDAQKQLDELKMQLNQVDPNDSNYVSLIQSYRQLKKALPIYEQNASNIEQYLQTLNQRLEQAQQINDAFKAELKEKDIDYNKLDEVDSTMLTHFNNVNLINEQTISSIPISTVDFSQTDVFYDKALTSTLEKMKKLSEQYYTDFSFVPELDGSISPSDFEKLGGNNPIPVTEDYSELLTHLLMNEATSLESTSEPYVQYASSTENQGNPLEWPGESCTRGEEDLNWSCESLGDYDVMGSNQNRAWSFMEEIPLTGDTALGHTGKNLINFTTDENGYLTSVSKPLVNMIAPNAYANSYGDTSNLLAALGLDATQFKFMPSNSVYRFKLTEKVIEGTDFTADPTPRIVDVSHHGVMIFNSLEEAKAFYEKAPAIVNERNTKIDDLRKQVKEIETQISQHNNAKQDLYNQISAFIKDNESYREYSQLYDNVLRLQIEYDNAQGEHKENVKQRLDAARDELDHYFVRNNLTDEKKKDFLKGFEPAMALYKEIESHYAAISALNKQKEALSDEIDQVDRGYYDQLSRLMLSQGSTVVNKPSGTLRLSKQITGKNSQEKTYQFNIQLAGHHADTLKMTINGQVYQPEVELADQMDWTVSLQAGQTLEIKGLDQNSIYTITELPSKDELLKLTVDGQSLSTQSYSTGQQSLKDSDQDQELIDTIVFTNGQKTRRRPHTATSTHVEWFLLSSFIALAGLVLIQRKTA